MTGEFYARLTIFSDILNPDQVSSMLELKYDKGSEKGDIIRPHGIVHQRRHTWSIYSQISRTAEMEDHVKDILDRVTTLKDKIKNLADQPGNNVELSCIIHSKEKPPLSFTKETVAALCQMGASIDCDLNYFDRTWKVDTGLKSSNK